MQSTSKPWFEYSENSDHLEFGDSKTRWPKGTEGPGLADARETTQHLVEVLKPVRLLILAPILAWLLIWWAPLILGYEGDDALFYQLALSVPCWAFLFALAKPARRLALGEKLSVRQAFQDTLSVYLQVVVATALTAILLVATMMSCVVPFFCTLPLVFRTPYEASRGMWPIVALPRSSTAFIHSTSTTAMALLDILYAIIALALLRILADSLTSLGLPEIPVEVMNSVLQGGVYFVLWHQCLASFLNGDAVMSGHLHPGNLAESRTPTKSRSDQFFLGEFFGGIRIFLVFVGVAAVFDLLDEPDSRLVYPTDHLIRPGHAAPEFSLEVLDGPVQTSSEYLGTPTIYYLWAPWCGACTAQNDVMREVQTTVGEEVDIVSIAVSFEDLDELRDYVRDHEINYEVLVGDDDISEQFNLNSYPTVILVDAQGLVHSNWAGSALSEEIHTALEELEK